MFLNVVGTAPTSSAQRMGLVVLLTEARRSLRHLLLFLSNNSKEKNII